MRETKLRFLTDKSGPSMVREANAAFLAEDFISHHDIRKLAEEIAADIQRHGSKIENRTIIEAFSLLDIIYNYDLKSDRVHFYMSSTNPMQEFRLELPAGDSAAGGDSVVVGLAEIKAALERLRQALILELATLLDPDTYHVLTGVLQKKIFTTHDNRLIKFIDVWHRDRMKEHFKAMRRLYNLPEHSPYILYPVMAKSRQHDVEILRRMNITTVEAFMKQRPQPPLRDTMRYFADNVRGLHFLLQQGFVHSDHSLDNMGVDLDHDRGSLFDLDGLLNGNHLAYGYPCKNPYRPPEMQAPDARILFGSQQMAYEVGYGLSEIRSTYRLGERQWQPSDPEHKIRELTLNLTEYNPLDRLSFAEAIQKLDTIIQQL